MRFFVCVAVLVGFACLIGCGSSSQSSDYSKDAFKRVPPPPGWRGPGEPDNWKGPTGPRPGAAAPGIGQPGGPGRGAAGPPTAKR